MEIPGKDTPSPQDGLTCEEQRSYLFDMLAQLSRIASVCGEPGVALVLQTIVVTRTGSELPVLGEQEIH